MLSRMFTDSAVRVARRLKAGPATNVGKCAVACAAASGVGLATAFAAPDRGEWRNVGMAGVAVGLAFGLASAAPALAAIHLRRDRAISTAAACLPFGVSVYLIARSLSGESRTAA
jgi:hypothetical protein